MSEATSVGDILRQAFELEATELEALADPLTYYAAFRKMARDMRKANVLLSDQEARFLVSAYYTFQESRKRRANQVRQMVKTQEPHEYLNWMLGHDEQLEEAIKLFLGSYVLAHPMGAWLENVKGIGPVLAAGLLASIDMNRCPTVGHIWAFAGWAADGQKKWEKGKKRPFSQGFRKLCHLVGISFMRFSNDPECVYGRLYRARKAYEVAGNDAGRYRKQAEREAPLKSRTTEAWPWNAACYAAGSTQRYYDLPDIDQRNSWLKQNRGEPGSGLPMLHPGHIDDRSRRHAVKQFLSDLHGAWYRLHYAADPPKPYPIAILGHAHQRPN